MANIAFAPVGKLIELLNTATQGEDAFVRVVGVNRLALGVDPFRPSYIIDIAREIVIPCGQAEPAMASEHQDSLRAPEPVR